MCREGQLAVDGGGALRVGVRGLVGRGWLASLASGHLGRGAGEASVTAVCETRLHTPKCEKYKYEI